MAYEVTATRKRPQVFEKLVGQEFVVSTIENAIASGRIAHAYLFSGPRGVGKTTSARLLAKALNCEHGPTAHPCGQCASCREITSGSSVDVIEIDGASNTSVNDIRVIKDEVLFPPQSSRYKIYIIDEVHMLSNSAFNALLKTIEEPPSYIIFIFATTELQKVPATIRSRCQQFHFQLIGLEDIKACLAEAANEMGIKADDDALFWIAKEGAGSMRDAYTLFDQVAAFSGDHITLAGIRDKLGLVGSDQVGALVSLAIGGRRKEALESLAAILSKGVSVEQCIRDFTDFFRSLLFLKDGIDSPELLSVMKDDIPQALVESLSEAQVEAALRGLMQTYREVRYSISPRFELELFVSRLSSLRFLTSQEELVARLEAMKEDIANGRATVVKEPVTLPPVQVIQEAGRPLGQPTAKADGCGQDGGQDAELASTTQLSPGPQVTPGPMPDLVQDEDEEDEAPRWTDDGEAMVESPADPAKEIMSSLAMIREKAEDSGVFGLGSLIGEVHSVVQEEGQLLLCTSSSFAQKSISTNMSSVREIVREVTGYAGPLGCVVRDKESGPGNPLLEKLAKALRGRIVIHDKEEGNA